MWRRLDSMVLVSLCRNVMSAAPRTAIRMSVAAQDIVAAAAVSSSLVAAAAPPFDVIRTPAQAESFLADHDAFLFDCDGVLWRGEDGLLPRTVETLEMLERLGKRCVFVTNNAAKSRAAYVKRFAGLGLERVTLDQVVPSSFVAARWLAQNRPEIKKVFVIGASGLVDELQEAGIEVLTARSSAFSFPSSNPDSNEASTSMAELGKAVASEPEVGAVVVGHDTGFDFKALTVGLQPRVAEAATLCTQAATPCAQAATLCTRAATRCVQALCLASLFLERDDMGARRLASPRLPLQPCPHQPATPRLQPATLRIQPTSQPTPMRTMSWPATAAPATAASSPPSPQPLGAPLTRSAASRRRTSPPIWSQPTGSTPCNLRHVESAAWGSATAHYRGLREPTLLAPRCERYALGTSRRAIQVGRSTAGRPGQSRPSCAFQNQAHLHGWRSAGH
jgi:HAD superfamily hydrolase (TIGR01450 family)